MAEERSILLVIVNNYGHCKCSFSSLVFLMSRGTHVFAFNELNDDDDDDNATL